LRGKNHLAYSDSIDAFKKLIRSADGSVDLTRSSSALQTLPNGLPYYFTEITGKNGCKYCIESYGEEAIELFNEVTDFSNGSRYHKSSLIEGDMN
jgi:hypothetical protein